ENDELGFSIQRFDVIVCELRQQICRKREDRAGTAGHASALRQFLDQRSCLELFKKGVPLRTQAEMRDAVVGRLIDFVMKKSEMAGGVLTEVRFACAGDADDEPDLHGVGDS